MYVIANYISAVAQNKHINSSDTKQASLPVSIC